MRHCHRMYARIGAQTGKFVAVSQKECRCTSACIFAKCCPVLLRLATVVWYRCMLYRGVCPAVCHTPVLYRNAWENTPARNRRYTLADSPVHSYFLVLNILMKFEWVAFSGVPNGGAVDNIGDFRPISRYISETVQHRNIVSIDS